MKEREYEVLRPGEAAVRLNDHFSPALFFFFQGRSTININNAHANCFLAIAIMGHEAGGKEQ